MCIAKSHARCICLEIDVTLDAHVGSVNAGSINGHVHVGGPSIILPFDIEVIVGLEVGRQGTVVAKTTLPLDREIAVGVDGRGDAVVIINLLREGDFLVFSRGSELNVGLVVAVVHDDVTSVILEVETRSNSDARAISIKALGGLDGLDMKVVASRSSETKREIIICVGGINVKVGVVAFLSIHFGASRNSAERSDMRCSEHQ